jgi:hypothetical protein
LSETSESWSEGINPNSDNEICLAVFANHDGDLVDALQTKQSEIINKLNC